MPITKTIYNSSSTSVSSVETSFVGRVLRIETVQSLRNWSKSWEHTDYRQTNCKYALVWLGSRGIPGFEFEGRMTLSERGEARDLEPHEQFVWVDCTHMLVRGEQGMMVPEVDAFYMQLLHGGPLMLENFSLWEAHEARRAVRAPKVQNQD